MLAGVELYVAVSRKYDISALTADFSSVYCEKSGNIMERCRQLELLGSTSIVSWLLSRYPGD